jgi:glyoxylase-like metal-dependent hydrolase (beta-lactamase superfamily II)
MERLWGEFLAVPAANLQPLTDGDEVPLGDRRVRVAATPGHASHHVCYIDPATRTAFTGDTAGVRLEGTDLVLPPTPPPDIHLASWRESIETLRRAAPERLVLTHFGAVSEVDAHLDALTSSLDRWSRRVRRLLEGDADEALAQATFVDEVEGTIRARVDPAAADALVQAVTPALCWLGLARYWRKHGGAAGP